MPKTKPKPKSRRDELNNPFINTFNALKGIYYPSRMKRLIKRTNKKESQIKSLRQKVLERKNESEKYSQPVKHTRKSRKKYVAPPSTIITRSMRRSQENPFSGIEALIQENIKTARHKPSKKRSKTANVSL
jgi:hypothetical protein